MDKTYHIFLRTSLEVLFFTVIVLDKKFRFTVVTAFYNTGEYLKESIESVINQDIGFEDNIQYILVNDGSSDEISMDIALQYQKQYPENILVLTKENGGPASARNLGLKHVMGEFVNFLDSDDSLSTNSMSAVDNFLQEHDDVNIVSMLLKYFGGKRGNHHLNYKFHSERVIDLEEEYDCPQLHISSSFIKANLLKDKEFEVNLINGEDLLLLNELFIHEKRYGVVNSAHYNYRKRPESSSIMDTSKQSERFYLEKMQNCFKELINYSIDNLGTVPNFIQYVIALDLNAIIESPFFEEIYTDNEDLNEFWDCLDDILSYISEDIIKDHLHLKDDMKSFYLFLKNKDFNIEVDSIKNKVFLKTDDLILNRLHSHRIYFDIVEIKNQFLYISGSYVSKCIPEAIRFEAIAKNVKGEEITYPCENVTYPRTERDVKRLLGVPWRYFYNFDVKIPLEDDDLKITFRLIYDENNQTAVMKPKLGFRPYASLSFFSNYLVHDSKIVLYRDGALHYVNYSKRFRLMLELKSIFTILKSGQKYRFYSVFIRIISALSYVFIRNKRIWLLIDRPAVADDNAKHLFEYSVKQNDDVSKYFIVDKDTTYFKEMKKINSNIIPFGSLKHKILYLHAEKIISSHVNHDWLNPFFYKNPKLYSGLGSAKKCFLQHGVTKDDVSTWFRKFYHNLYLFVTASEYERQSIINGDYNYPDDVVQLLGFPRFDNLKKDKDSKQILFLPTWRSYLKTEADFNGSDYHNFLNSFFNNEMLLELARKNGYKIIFKPHFDLIRFLPLLDLPEDIVISHEESYQDLFNSSSLLITDYSSVSFDFAYLKKPVIYYRGIDKYHNESGYFDFETMGFGEIIKSEDVLIDKIEEYLENAFEMEEEYKRRVEDFFKFMDKNNSKRVYEWLLNHPD